LKHTWLLLAALASSACAVHPAGSSRAPGPLQIPASTAATPSQPPADQRALIVDAAGAMIGQPYQFGGAAPGGFDCSGLVLYAASGAGIRVPRTAREQMDFGVSVRRADVSAGDLVFMHLSHKELHVGIAIDRDRFIHAPSTGGRVRIDSLAAPPYAKGFLSARRIVAAP
jgi:cell wall-associated NlpC family hydrolase